jgi:ferredoxin
MTRRDPAAAWRLVLDASRCDGHGICALLCSERVRLDDWGYAAVEHGPIHERAVVRRAARAVAACPEGALTLVEVPRDPAQVPAGVRTDGTPAGKAQFSTWTPVTPGRRARRAGGRAPVGTRPGPVPRAPDDGAGAR